MNDSILAPRELLERALSELMDWEAADDFEAVKRTHDELRTLLAQPASEPKPVETAEPVAWRNFDGEGNYDYTDDEDTAEAWTKHNGPKYADWCQPLFTHPAPAVAALKLPERMRDSCRDSDVLVDAQAEGWNACLDATIALNNLEQQP